MRSANTKSKVESALRHRREHGDLRIRVSHVVEGHLVEAEKFAHLGDVEGLHANVARDHDGFEGLARCNFELFVARQGEVVLGSHGLRHLDPRPNHPHPWQIPGSSDRTYYLRTPS